MFKNLIRKAFGDPGEREAKRLKPVVDQINALAAEFEGMSDDELRGQTDAFRATIAERVGTLRDDLAQAREEWLQEPDVNAQNQLRLEVQRLEKELRQAEAEAMQEILPRAFAAVREASVRTTGMRHFDVQLIGGMVLHQGKIAEMKTGEGKTLVATLPLYLNALTGRGAHLVTPNDYLSKWGVQWMGPIYHLLGVSVGVIQSAAANPELGSFVFDPEYPAADDRYRNLRPVARREAYYADVTYGTNNEFGFDYLRDNMVQNLDDCAQRELVYAIVDEVDNILIDEARTPLIISGQAQESSDYYRSFAQVVRRLTPERDYKVDEKDRLVTLTDDGIARVESLIGLGAGQSLYDADHYEMNPYLDNALRANVLYKLDRDYIVKEGEVIIVDEFTGRLMHGRRFSEGLHQAIEAKEGVRVQRESLTLATITFQNYFRMYTKLAGMTGTALTEAEEFYKIYRLDVVAIPTHRTVDPRGLAGSDLQVGASEVSRGGQRDCRSAQEGSAGAGRHGGHRDLRDVVRTAEAQGCAAQRPQRQTAREGGRHHHAGGASGHGDDRDQHGRPRRGHPARWQRRWHGAREAAQTGHRPGRALGV